MQQPGQIACGERWVADDSLQYRGRELDRFGVLRGGEQRQTPTGRDAAHRHGEVPQHRRQMVQKSVQADDVVGRQRG